MATEAMDGENEDDESASLSTEVSSTTTQTEGSNSQTLQKDLEDCLENIQEIAIKMYRKKDIKVQTMLRLKKDVELLLLLRGKRNIVQLYGLSQDKYYLYLLMELCPNGTLVDRIKKEGKLSLPLARFYAAELLDLIELMHSKGIVHRQLVPEKIMLGSDNHIRLGNFSYATMGDRSQWIEEITEKNYFYCPEIISQRSTSKSSDLWAFGCLLCFMLSGKLPFRASTKEQLEALITGGEFSLEGIEDLHAIDLITRLLVVDPALRIGANSKDYRDIKNHPFFQDIFVRFQESNWTLKPPKEPKPLSALCIEFLQKNHRNHWPLDYPWELRLPKELLEKIFHSVANLEELRKGKKYLLPEETIIMSGLIWRKSFLLRRSYQAKLVLTSFPRFLILDAKKSTVKEDIRWIPSECMAHSDSSTTFFLRTKKKSMQFELVSPEARKWVEKIIDVKKEFM